MQIQSTQLVNNAGAWYAVSKQICNNSNLHKHLTLGDLGLLGRLNVGLSGLNHQLLKTVISIKVKLF